LNDEGTYSKLTTINSGSRSPNTEACAPADDPDVVILHLHGTLGSQNGYDNSGKRTGSPSAADVASTLDVVGTVAGAVGGLMDVIELLNEVTRFCGQQWANTVHGPWQNGYNVVWAMVGLV